MLKHEIVDGQTGQVFVEKTLGEKWIEWGYQDRLGRAVTHNSFLQKLISSSVGAFMKSPFSRPRISKFIEEFDIKMSDFEGSVESFESFNDFFIRKLRPNVRHFPTNPQELGCPAEGRVSVYPLNDKESPLYFKGKKLSLTKFLNTPEDEIKDFLGGWAYVIRLCPIDYHRFHFAAQGPVTPPKRIAGLLHSVNPLSLLLNSLTFEENERQLCYQNSHDYGRLAYIEVGALCVGAIKQSFNPEEIAQKGQEKGYFEFGGSTQILLAGPQLSPLPHLLKNTAENRETLIRLGEPIASLKS